MNTQNIPLSVPLPERVATIAACLDEHKAQNIVCLDISKESGGGFADRLFIATAGSPRHARSLVDALAEICHANGYDYLRVEGYNLGEWVLVDLNDIVVSVFLEETRATYKLEDLWCKAPREALAVTGAPAGGQIGRNTDSEGVEND